MDMPELRRGHYMWFIGAGSFVPGKGYRPSLVIEGVAGHWPYPDDEGVEPWYWGKDLFEAIAKAGRRNRGMGLTDADELRIFESSLQACDEWRPLENLPQARTDEIQGAARLSA